MIVFIVVIIIMVGFMTVPAAIKIKESNIITKKASPNGEYIAYIYEKNSGATSWFVYRLAILKKEDSLTFFSDQAYIAQEQFDIEWEGDLKIKVHNNPTKIYRQKFKEMNITIDYDYME